jgi:Mur ligase middle domain
MLRLLHCCLQILAGVADRGGQSAVIECTTTGLHEGRWEQQMGTLCLSALLMTVQLCCSFVHLQRRKNVMSTAPQQCTDPLTAAIAVLVLRRTDEVDFDVAVFTNLSSDNLHDGFGVGPAETLEEHLDIMAGLFRRLQDSDRQRAIINVDGECQRKWVCVCQKVKHARIRHGRPVLAAQGQGHPARRHQCGR